MQCNLPIKITTTLKKFPGSTPILKMRECGKHEKSLLPYTFFCEGHSKMSIFQLRDFIALAVSNYIVLYSTAQLVTVFSLNNISYYC